MYWLQFSLHVKEIEDHHFLPFLGSAWFLYNLDRGVFQEQELISCTSEDIPLAHQSHSITLDCNLSVVGAAAG